MSDPGGAGRPAGGSARGLLAFCIAAALAGCASAVNYLDPGGPLYTWNDARTRGVPPSSAPLRVVSFNIAHAIRIDRAIEVLQESAPLRAPDILALQEMDAPGTGRIARALGMNAVYFPSAVHPAHGKDFGCAILSPWPLVEPRKLILPHHARGSGLRRAATSAVVVRGGQRIRVYSVHLPSPQGVSGNARRDQIRALARDADSVGTPLVIVGDFNSRGKVEELANAGFDWITRDLGATRPVRFLGIRLFGFRYDHVLARGLRRIDGPDAVGVVKNSRGASDHRPIWAVLVPQ